MRSQIVLAIGVIGLFLSSLLGLGSCANVGSPEGGPYDVAPPRLIRSTPAQGATEVHEQTFRLRFDEFIKLSGQEKIIVSPPQKTPPRITASGKEVIIRLEDSLRPETTYNFYFDDAIVDNNEDNPLEGFGYSVSTGKHIDSMQIGGLVLNAQTLEPVGELILGAYPTATFADSSFRKEMFPFASKSNKQGVFTIRGLKDDQYRLFALKDADNDYHFSLPTEGIAFARESYKTTKRDSVKTDTIRIDSIVRRDTLHRDSLVTYPHTFYYPDNVLLRYFEPEVVRLGIDKAQRLDEYICAVSFLTPLQTFPQARLLSPSSSRQPYFASFGEDNQLQYWLRDSVLRGADSLKLEIKYQKTDSLMQVKEQTDTLTFYKPRAKTRTASNSKAQSKEDDKPKLTLTFSRSKGIEADTPEDSLILLVNQPVDSLPSSVIKLEGTTDSVYKAVDFRLIQDSLNRLKYQLDFPHPYGSKFRIHVDSASVSSIYGLTNDSTSFNFNIQSEKEFGRLSVRLEGLDSLAVVELLDKSDKVIASQLAQPLPTDSIQQTKNEEAKPSEDPILAQLLNKQQKSAGTKAKKSETKKEQQPTTNPPTPSATGTDSLTTGKSDSLVKKTIPSLQVNFKDLKTGEYYLRVYVDTNRDGKWTTGEYPSREPEAVYYCPATFSIKKGFTSEEVWKVFALPLDKQKPEALRKVKPEEKKKREDKNAEYYKRIGKK